MVQSVTGDSGDSQYAFSIIAFMYICVYDIVTACGLLNP